MGIIITINGNTGPEGFLIAPASPPGGAPTPFPLPPPGPQEFPVSVGLKTDDRSTVDAVLGVVAGSGVIVQLSKTNVTIGPTQKFVKITAKTRSRKKGDIKLEVKVGGRVRASFTLTSIENPHLRFGGRFQARFATDSDFYNHPRGTSAGWTWALEDEPDFVPATNNVPINPGMAVGRVVHFQNAVAPRPHVAPIGVKVTAIEGQVGLRILSTVSFTKGDPIIGAKVSLGPNTYFAGNEPQNPADPPPFETNGVGAEVLENFEFHVESSSGTFSGKSAALNDRPKGAGFQPLEPTQLTKYGIVPLATFNNTRKTALLNDYHALSPADRTGTVAGRNLATRISHLGGSAPDGIPPLPGTIPPTWTGQVTSSGFVNSAIQVTPGKSAVLAYLKQFPWFRFSSMFFNFHSDELCGQVDGTLMALTRGLLRLPE